MKKTAKVLLILLCAVLTGVFLFSGYKLYSIYHGYKSSEQHYNDLQERYAASPSPSVTPFAAPEASVAPEAAATAAPQVETSPIQQDVKALRADYPDVVGWIYSEGTKINYPVVRSASDNPNTAEYYYLYRDIDGNYSGNGTPFLDVRNSGNFSDYNNIIYGHHMNDGSMFASLDNYKKQEYYAEHPILYLNTPERNYKIEVFAGFNCHADSNTYNIAFPDETSFLLYCRDMKAQSVFQSDVEVQPGDSIVTLSTCAYDYHDERFVVQGRLIPLDAATQTGDFTVSAAG